MFKNILIPLLSLMIITSITSCNKEDLCDGVDCGSNYVCVNGECHFEFWYDDTEENTDNNEFNQGCESEELLYNGYTYDLVDIDGKCWFAENLRTTTFNNGDALNYEPVILNWTFENYNYNYIETWVGYNFSGSNGLLYSGNIIIDERNVCPVGWHVSSDDDWKEVELLIGMSEDQIDETGGLRGHGLRPILTSEDNYGIDSLGLNLKSTGFIGNCLVSDYDPSSGYVTTTYWSNNNDENTLLMTRNLNNISVDNIARNQQHRSHGSAVRCVKD